MNTRSAVTAVATTSGRHTRVRIVATLLLLITAVGTFPEIHAVDGAGRTPPELARFYGFSGIELFKVDDGVFNLQSGDFNHDGLTDAVVIDNHASSLRVFRQRTQKPADPSRPTHANDLHSDWRLESRQISVDRQVGGLTTGDFNGDGRLDLAYIGIPDQLAVRYQPEDADAEWTQKWTVRLPGLQPAAWMIAAGDLNNDRRTDIVVLAQDVTYVVYQQADGDMAAPVAMINTSSQLSLVQIADLNGDGRQDLCYVANEGGSRGLCARLQTSDGRLSPETTFDLQKPRSVTVHDVDQLPGREVITVDSRSGRLIVSALQPAESESGVLPTRLVQYGIGPEGGARNRSVAIGDLDNDQLQDVVVTDPEQAQLIVYRQNGIDGLGVAETFPGLVGAVDVAAADLDRDGAAEVLVLSDKEGILGLCQFEESRLTFPVTLMKKPAGTELVAVETIEGQNQRQIVVAATQGSGRSARLQLHRLRPADQGHWEPVGTEPPLELSGVSGSRGVDLFAMDVDQDGLSDLLVIPNGASEAGVQVVLQGSEGQLTVASQKSDLELGITSAGSVFRAGQQLMVARDSFARALRFGNSGWQVVDQFNAGEASARLEGVASIDLDGQPGDEIVLVDTGVRKLRVLRRADGLFRPWKEVDLGPIKYTSTIVGDFDGDGRNDLLLMGTQHFSVLYSGRTDSVLKEIATYESDRDDAYLADVIAGDINADHLTDLTVIDTSIDGLEILSFNADTGLEAVTHFRVFEEKRLVSDATSRGTEPREGLVADLTGDGRGDLILLCHDRLILYPQDPGNSATEPSSTSPAASAGSVP